MPDNPMKWTPLRRAVDHLLELVACFAATFLGQRTNSLSTNHEHEGEIATFLLMDQICPPPTVFAAYHHYRGPKEMRVFPYSGHDGGGVFQRRDRVRFMQAIWG